jgi:metallo-beta-lactamase family protein
MLIKWATHFSPKPQRVFVNHGDTGVCDFYANRLKDEFGLPATSPFSGSVYDLMKNEYVVEAKPSPLPERERKPDHEDQGAREQEVPYQQLLATLDRLSAQLRAGKGHSNREIRSITNQLAALSSEWDHE